MRKYSLIVENGHRRLYNYMGHSEWDYEAVNKKVSTYSATSKKSAQLSHLTNLPVDPVRHLMTILEVAPHCQLLDLHSNDLETDKQYWLYNIF